jgi:hypothetical protein
MNTLSDEMDQLEAKIAGSAAQLLQTVLQAARVRIAGTEQADMIDNLTAARLIVAAVGPEVTVQALAPDGHGGELLLIGFTAAEISGAICH